MKREVPADAGARRRAGPLAFVALAIALVGIGAVIAFAQASSEQRPRGVQLTPESADTVVNDAILSNAAWVFLPDGPSDILRVPELPALRFPPGTTYKAALTALYSSVVETGRLPSSAALTRALPRPVVVACRADGSLELSLIAPFGYDGSGAVRAPSYSLPGTLTPEEVGRRQDAARASGQALPDGATVDVPDLRPVQVLSESGARTCA